MPYMQGKERERKDNNPAKHKRVLLPLNCDKVLFLTIYFIVLLLSTWFSLACLNLASAIKWSPNVKCLINTSCHQEQLCLEWFFFFNFLGPIHYFLSFRELVSEKTFLSFWAFFFFPPWENACYRQTTISTSPLASRSYSGPLLSLWNELKCAALWKKKSAPLGVASM